MSLEAKFQAKHWIIISTILATGVIVALYYIETTASADKQVAQQAAQSVENGSALANAAGQVFSNWWASSKVNPSNW